MFKRLLVMVALVLPLSAQAEETDWDYYAKSLYQDVLDVGLVYANGTTETAIPGIDTDYRFEDTDLVDASGASWYFDVGSSLETATRYYSVDSLNAGATQFVILDQIGSTNGFNVTFADSIGISGTTAQVYVPSGSPEAGQVAGFGIALSLLMGRLVSRRKRVQSESVKSNTVLV